MCVSRGAPRKPSYGPCNEKLGHGDLAVLMHFMIDMRPIIEALESVLKLQMKEAGVCV